jgi:hypothetical protein
MAMAENSRTLLNTDLGDTERGDIAPGSLDHGQSSG